MVVLHLLDERIVPFKGNLDLIARGVHFPLEPFINRFNGFLCQNERLSTFLRDLYDYRHSFSLTCGKALEVEDNESSDFIVPYNGCFPYLWIACL